MYGRSVVQDVSRLYIFGWRKRAVSSSSSSSSSSYVVVAAAAVLCFVVFGLWFFFGVSCGCGDSAFCNKNLFVVNTNTGGDYYYFSRRGQVGSRTENGGRGGCPERERERDVRGTYVEGLLRLALGEVLASAQPLDHLAQVHRVTRHLLTSPAAAAHDPRGRNG